MYCIMASKRFFLFVSLVFFFLPLSAFCFLFLSSMDHGLPGWVDKRSDFFPFFTLYPSPFTSRFQYLALMSLRPHETRAGCDILLLCMNICITSTFSVSSTSVRIPKVSLIPGSLSNSQVSFLSS
ncbi:uncharacterized protein BDV17DRAFT_142136 [Aspergillus undulatus]|uniref:uncharacterized protein n=1 Tax=Aspergillus undulatus TaxID=1810928 RepID=UPI003CCDDF2E